MGLVEWIKKTFFYCEYSKKCQNFDDNSYNCTYAYDETQGRRCFKKK